MLAWRGTLGPHLVPFPSSVTRLLSTCEMCAHVCVCMFSEGLVPENTPPLPAAYPQPSPLLLITDPPPVSWLGNLRMSLVSFPGCLVLVVEQGCSGEVVQ